ncbi:MAG: cyclic nucleotide-binding domain-containing protein [Chitinophagaceae bacterium]|nr:cyclic nucleotide-binding domain-containing protein [Chitinophagaceae bacterium]
MSDEQKFIPTVLPKEQAIQLTEFTKTKPQMEGVSSRNVIKHLPWVNVSGGNYRVNRRQILEIRPNEVSFLPVGNDQSKGPQILAQSLNQMPSLSKIKDQAVLEELAASAVRQEYDKDSVILHEGTPPTHIYIIYNGKVSFYQSGVYETANETGHMSAGQYFGGFGLHFHHEVQDDDVDDVIEPDPKFMTTWAYSAVARTKLVVFSLAYAKVMDILNKYLNPGENLGKFLLTHKEVEELAKRSNRKGEAGVQLFAGFHEEEPSIPTTYVAYDPNPRVYELSSVQTILKVHTKVADLYNAPYNQTEEQVRLTVEELREAQEYEMINNKEFGLLHNADYRQRIQTMSGPPTPDDLDELISRRRKTQYIFAPSKAIAAFTRECNKRGIFLPTVDMDGRQVLSWRGIPILTCNKIPVENGVTSMIAVRTGVDNQGVVGLYQMGLPDEIESSMSVRFMGIDEKAIISYLITNYFSVAVLVPDALGILENVEVGVYGSNYESNPPDFSPAPPIKKPGGKGGPKKPNK